MFSTFMTQLKLSWWLVLVVATVMRMSFSLWFFSWFWITYGVREPFVSPKGLVRICLTHYSSLLILGLLTHGINTEKYIPSHDKGISPRYCIKHKITSALLKISRFIDLCSFWCHRVNQVPECLDSMFRFMPNNTAAFKRRIREKKISW